VSAPLRLYVLGTAISEPGTLGGDTRILLELVRRWTARGEVQATIVTSATRKETCVGYRLPQSVTYQICPETPGVWSLAGHLRAAVRLDRLAARLDPGPDRPTTVVYSASDFLTDVLPAARLRRRFPNATWLASRFLFVPALSRVAAVLRRGIGARPSLRWRPVSAVRLLGDPRRADLP
jgi:hypothetical protein